MAKEAYYFSHDSNARRDPKILAMRNEYGNKGYGWYWILVEMLSEQDDYMLKHTKWVSHAIAMEMLCDTTEAEKFVFSCIEDYELFESDGEHFWSESLLRRMNMKEAKRKKRVEAGKKGAQSRWSDSNAIAKPKQTDSIAMAKDGKGKESKVKESKEKESKDKSAVQQTELFESWWNLYDNKKGKVKCESKYKSLLKKWSHESMMAGTQRYLDHRKKLEEANEFLPQQKNPLTFLNGEHFNDEYTEISGGGNRPGTYQQITPATNDASGIDW